MFGSVNIIKLTGSLTQEELATLREDVLDPFTREPGFRYYFGVQDADGTVATFHAWDSPQQCHEAVGRMWPRLESVIKGKIAGPAVRHQGEVLIEAHD